MSWSRRSLAAALLALHLPVAQADTVIVNTLTDDNADNTLCSLREAIEYFNLDKNLIEDPEDATETLAVYQGCKREGSASTNHVVRLPKEETPYLITSGEIVVRRSLTIDGGNDNDEERTPITVSGGSRAFLVHDPDVVRDNAFLDSIPAPNPALPPAPQLDASSDTGDSDSDRFTQDRTPKIIGTGQPAGVYLAAYARLMPSGTPTLVGQSQANGAGEWAITLEALENGLYEIYVTSRNVETDPPSATPETNLLRIQIYALKPQRLFAITEVDLQGCAAACVEDEGGLIWTSESVSFTDSVLRSGHASVRGGAIYGTDTAGLQLTGSELSANVAPDGGAVFMERNALTVNGSLFVTNQATGVDGALISTASEDGAAGINFAQVVNSTFSGNTVGLVLSLRENAVVNNVTMVMNAGGIDFNNENVRVYNSVLAGNGSNDCLNLPATPAMKSNLITATGGCPAATADNAHQVISNTADTSGQLMATVDAHGFCSGAFGLLCPLAMQGEDKLRSHLPRVLAAYTSISDSPLVNRGGATATAGTVEACLAVDQRGQSRNSSACDIGAIELQPITGIVRTGDAISNVESYTPTAEEFRELLGDEELLPAALCPATPYTDAIAGTYRSDLPGCPWVEVAPQRGTVTFNANGSYTYTPTARFHGFDPFTVRVITTVSKLNTQPVNRSRVLDGQVIVEPVKGIKNDSLGGAAGVWWLLCLAGFGLLSARVREN